MDALLEACTTSRQPGMVCCSCQPLNDHNGSDFTARTIQPLTASSQGFIQRITGSTPPPLSTSASTASSPTLLEPIRKGTSNSPWLELPHPAANAALEIIQYGLPCRHQTAAAQRRRGSADTALRSCRQQLAQHRASSCQVSAASQRVDYLLDGSHGILVTQDSIQHWTRCRDGRTSSRQLLLGGTQSAC
jgi:hypothetical protein